ncbi:alpha-amylase [bacterium]|nr:MAG: alpha-amylase [bacterium]
MTSTAQSTIRLFTTTHPLVYEVNARMLLKELSVREGKPVTLGTIPDDVIQAWADEGLDAVWLMGIWATGPVGVKIAREHEGLRLEYKKVLADFIDADVIGSPYAIRAYEPAEEIGGFKGLAALYRRMKEHRLGLILDFVCNHTARDHDWVASQPEYYVQGDKGDDVKRPDAFFRTRTKKGDRVIAFGRDPVFPGWTDTAQLNYNSAAMRRATIQEMRTIAAYCDGLRCDMAMLVLNDVFHRTWTDLAPREGPAQTEEFWKEAIRTIKAEMPQFKFIAEAYWDLEWELQQLGFDFTYDKVLYDRLLREGASAVREHLKAEIGYQMRSIRFIENHDEPPAAVSLPSDAWQYAAATIASTVPGMVLYHDGQFEGRSVKVPVQLARRPSQPVNTRTRSFYKRLLSCLTADVFRRGEWRLLTVRPAWHDNPTWQDYLAFWWEEPSSGIRLVVVNYAPHNSQCYIDLPQQSLGGSPMEFRDLLGKAVYVRERNGLISKGMFFDLPAYGLHIFHVAPAKRKQGPDP